MKNVTERTLAFLLSLLLFLSSSSLVSLFGKNTGGLVGEAKAEGEEGEEPTPTLPEGVPAGYHEYDLYNFIHVNGAGQDTGFGRLRLTKIYTKDTMETYHSLSLESSEPYLIPEGEYKYYPEVYDFSAEGNRVITLQTTQSGNKKYEGVYLLFDYYLNELKNGNTIDLSSPKMDGFFLVKGTERSPRYFQNKIGGSSFGWVYPDMAGQSSSARPCFHCDYLIEVSKIVDLPVYNLLGVTGRDFTEHNTGKYYRLSDRNTAITLPFLFDFDSVIGEKKTIDPSGEYYRVLLPESDDYNFNNLQLTFNIDGVDYTFSYQPDSNYVPNSPTFEPYYTVELEGISYSDSIHGDPDWYGNTNGWLGDETHPEWPSSNSTPSYHRNYKATLHREGDTHSIKFYGSDDKTIPPIDNHQQVIGSKTTFNGASLPTKDGDAEYNYVFSGWKNSRGVIFSYTDSVNNELPNVGRNEEYTPVFTAISKRITITAASDEWTYDGSAHENTTVTVTSGELLPGDTLVAEATGSVTNVSDTAANNNPVAAGYKIMHGDEDVTASYVITTEAGTLTINPGTVIITAKSEEFTYDGNSHSNDGYDVDGLVGSDAISVVVTGSITYPSQSPVTNVLTSYEFTSGTAGNYIVTTANGQLTMTNASIAITITAASDEWT
ncbi:MAG: hypothetical protein J5872_06875, partial [Lachnospiraceae bacterium]|nr:hypothetical protein [Lachnospiraceae bacterium]